MSRAPQPAAGTVQQCRQFNDQGTGPNNVWAYKSWVVTPAAEQFSLYCPRADVQQHLQQHDFSMDTQSFLKQYFGARACMTHGCGKCCCRFFWYVRSKQHVLGHVGGTVQWICRACVLQALARGMSSQNMRCDSFSGGEGCVCFYIPVSVVPGQVLLLLSCSFMDAADFGHPMLQLD